ncbi:MAG: Gldg family protein [Christensenellales bacterium]|jgi:ABC-2 type transport system permease protein
MNKNVNERTKINPVKRFFTRRQFRYGWYATLSTVLFVALVLALNVVVQAAENKWALKIDATGNAITAFSDKTYETIASVEDDVYIHLVYTANSNRAEKMNVEEIAAKYQARNGKIHVDTIDPNTEPTRINAYKEKTNTASITEGAIIVTNADESRIKVVAAKDVYSKELDFRTYLATQQERYIDVFNAEGQLTSALMYVTSSDTPRILFLEGQNEVASAYCSTLTGSLTNENYDVGTVTLGKGDIELVSGDTLVILMPELDLTDTEYETLRTFVEGGGRMLYVHDPNMSIDTTPNFKRLLDYFGFAFESGYVVEDDASTSNWLNQRYSLLPNKDAESAITSTLAQSRIILPMSAASIAQPDPRSGFVYTNLLTTSAKAYLKTMTTGSDASNLLVKEETDQTGPFTLAMSLLKQVDVKDSSKDIRMVVLGSPYLVVDALMNSSNNLDFAMNAIDWLVNREVSAYVRSKSLLSTTLAIPDSGTALLLFIVVVVVLPLGAFAFGVVTWIKRRRL